MCLLKTLVAIATSLFQKVLAFHTENAIASEGRFPKGLVGEGSYQSFSSGPCEISPRPRGGVEEMAGPPPQDTVRFA